MSVHLYLILKRRNFWPFFLVWPFLAMKMVEIRIRCSSFFFSLFFCLLLFPCFVSAFFHDPLEAGVVSLFSTFRFISLFFAAYLFSFLPLSVHVSFFSCFHIQLANIDSQFLFYKISIPTFLSGLLTNWPRLFPIQIQSVWLVFLSMSTRKTFNRKIDIGTWQESNDLSDRQTTGMTKRRRARPSSRGHAKW